MQPNSSLTVKANTFDMVDSAVDERMNHVPAIVSINLLSKSQKVVRTSPQGWVLVHQKMRFLGIELQGA